MGKRVLQNHGIKYIFGPKYSDFQLQVRLLQTTQRDSLIQLLFYLGPSLLPQDFLFPNSTPVIKKGL